MTTGNPTDDALASWWNRAYDDEWNLSHDVERAKLAGSRAVFNAGMAAATVTTDRDVWEEVMGRHEPVLSFRDGHIAGCQCMDRVFYRPSEDWASHLADAVIATLAAPESGEPNG